MKIGIAIPSYKGHIIQLIELLDNIENQTKLPDKVCVSCSSTVDFPEIKKYNFPLEIVTTTDKKNAAENRNIASSKLLDMDYISFFDADDLMHPQRIEIIWTTCKNREVDLLLHDYYNESEKNPNYSEPILDIDVKYDSLCQCVSGCARHKNQHYGNIHHSQVTVKRNILDLVTFPEEREYCRKEDSVFCNRVLGIENIKSAYIVNKLSFYRPSGTVF